MTTPLLDLDGTAEEIQKHRGLQELVGSSSSTVSGRIVAFSLMVSV